VEHFLVLQTIASLSLAHKDQVGTKKLVETNALAYFAGSGMNREKAL